VTAHAPLTCEEVLALLSDYLDGDLGPERLATVEEHLHACENCTRFGGQFRATLAALREHLRSASPLPDGLRERLRAIVRDDPE
jgi:anti-sigma factor RsiW